MSRVSKKTFLNTKETRQSGFPRRKEKTKEKAGGHLLPTRAKIRRAVQKELSKCQPFYTKPSVDTKNIDRRLSGFFVFPWESLSASMKKTQGGRRRKKRSPTKNIFREAVQKHRKRRVKRPPTPREYATPRRSYRPVWRCILPPRREWFRHRISGPASRVCSTVRAAKVRPRATG